MCRHLREQTRSHTGFEACTKTNAHRSPSVGAKLARDSGLSGSINIECAAIFASKPAPTLVLRHAQKPMLTAAPMWEQSLLAIAVCQATSILTASPPSRASPPPTGFEACTKTNAHRSPPVGAKLARDSGLSGSINIECAAIFASKPAPPPVLRHAQKPMLTAAPLWEQSSLAIAVCQATSILTAPPPSRASPPPQGASPPTKPPKSPATNSTRASQSSPYNAALPGL